MIINLDEYRRKRKKTSDDSVIKAEMRDSLDNAKVLKNYGINKPEKKPEKKPEPPTIDERMQRIRESITRVNQLLRDLEDTKGVRP